MRRRGGAGCRVEFGLEGGRVGECAAGVVAEEGERLAEG
jgi:hypothetical protein